MNTAEDLCDEKVEVSVEYGDGQDGVGWYVFEAEYSEDGYVAFFDHDPTAEELMAICPEYHRG